MPGPEPPLPDAEPPDAERVVDLVAEALTVLERDGVDGLEALLAAHPAEAAVVRRRLALLGQHGLATDPAGAADVEPLGEELGEFRLLRPLGGGGMGVVWLAEQPSLGREVALKVVRPDQLLFPGARERFRREVETVARLQHPGIVPVYSVGEHRGLPYFAMERVRGLSLAEVVEALEGRDPRGLSGRDLAALLPSDQEGDAEEPGSALFEGPWPDVCMRIVREVAEALEHARRRGIVHRDVKPSNVMVTRGGRVLLLDFGLSWRAGDARITRTGSAVGSLAYMPPEALEEEASGDEPRQDVYSLGATLHELVALRPPFEARSRASLIRAISEGGAPPLRAGRPDVSWELATIVAVAMDRDPGRRYANAGALARDLASALERRPIEARPPGPVLRARRWLQRHPARAVVSLAVVLVPSVLFAREAQSRRVLEGKNEEVVAANAGLERANADLARALEEARAQRELAQESFGRALDAVDRMLLRVGEHRLSGEPRMEGIRRELAADALELYQWFLARGEGDRALAHEVARVALTTGDLHGVLGDLPAAERALDLAESLLLELLAADVGDVGAALSLAEVLSRRATTLRLGSRVAEARAAAQAAIDRLEGLPASAAGSPDAAPRRDRSRVLARAWSELGMLAQLEGDLDGAISAIDRAIEELRGLPSAGPEGARLRTDLARDLDLRGTVRAVRATTTGVAPDAEALEAALADHEEAARIFGELVDEDPSSPDPRFRRARALTNVARALGELGRTERGMAVAREALEVQEELAFDFPRVPAFVDDLSRTWLNLAAIHGGRGELAECEAALERAFAALDAVLELTPDDPEPRLAYGTGLVNLSALRQSQGDLPGALAALERAGEQVAAALERQPGEPRNRSVAWTVAYRAGGLHLALGSPGEALAAAEGLLEHGPGGEEAGAYSELAAAALGSPALSAPDRERALGRAAAGVARLLESGALTEESLGADPAHAGLRSTDGFAEALEAARAR